MNFKKSNNEGNPPAVKLQMMEVIVDITSSRPHRHTGTILLNIIIVLLVVLVLGQLLLLLVITISDKDNSIVVHHHVVVHRHYEVRSVNEVRHQIKGKDIIMASPAPAAAVALAVVGNIPHHHPRHYVQDKHHLRYLLHLLLVVKGKVVEVDHQPNKVISIHSIEIIEGERITHVTVTTTILRIIKVLEVLLVVVGAVVIDVIKMTVDYSAAVEEIHTTIISISITKIVVII